MTALVSLDFRLVPQGQSNVVESIQQAVSHEIVDRELGQKILVVADLATLQVDRNLISIDVLSPMHQFGQLIFLKSDGQESILCAVVGKDVSKRG